MQSVDFSGEYRLTCVADEAAAELGLTDKPCWRIDGPDGLVATVWTWRREPRKILWEFLDRELGLDLLGGVEPLVFLVPYAKPRAKRCG